jgi:HAD superfamily hydrolase (TIGR01509 family)
MPDVAVIFDMDGVLVDSYAPHFQSWKRLYNEFGIDYSEADFATDFGQTSRDILRRRWHEELTDESFREIDDRKEGYYREIIRENFPAMDGASELIEALAADGFAMAVGSSGPPENVQLAIEKLQSGRLISAKVTGADVKRGKPDPQVFLMAAERLGVPPASCAVIEDAVHGVEAARRAGMTAIALTGTSTRADLAAADLVIDSLRELSPARIRELVAARG